MTFAAALADLLDPPLWEVEGRFEIGEHQKPPPGDWGLWIFLGGRGAGKTEAGSRYVCTQMRRHPGWRGLIIAPTYGDAVEACVEGPSGILAIDPGARFVPSSPGGSKVVWPNGSEVLLIGTPTPREVERLRAAGNRHLYWWEEMAANSQLKAAWQIAFAGLREGIRPRQVATTTPRPVATLKALMADPNTVLTRGTVFDNPGVSDEVKAEMRRYYEGTRIGRQELYGELLEDVPGALWKREWFDYATAPLDLRVVVGVDPAVTANEDSALTGIVVAGFSNHEQRAYVLADLSLRATADEWAAVAIRAFHEYEASAIIAEKNQGGDLITSLFRNIDAGVPVRLVSATKGKLIRAEPIAIKYEQGRVSHVRPFPELEDQMASFTHDSAESPDRLDAAVWALWDLMVRGGRGGAINVAGYGPEPVRQVGDLRLVGKRYMDKDPR